MPTTAQAANSRSSATLKPALWILATFAVAQIAAIGWSFASRLELAPAGGRDGAFRHSTGLADSPNPEGLTRNLVADGSGAPTPAVGSGRIPIGSSDLDVSQLPPLDSQVPNTPSTTTVNPIESMTSPSTTATTISAADPTAILDTSAATHVRNGNALRTQGDTQGALEQYRLALELLPGHPRILYEIASTYDAMGFDDKAAQLWEQIYRLGEGAGELFVLADLKLRGSDGSAALSDERPIAINGIRTIPDDSVSAQGAQRIALHISLKAKAGVPIDTTLFETHVHFFDRVDGSRIEQTTADPPVSRWVTGPEIDWANFGEEVLEVVYYHPALTPAEIEQFGDREYYGFIVKVYYDNQLVDQAAEPRTLFEYLFQGTNPEPLLDNPLFLNE